MDVYSIPRGSWRYTWVAELPEGANIIIQFYGVIVMKAAILAFLGVTACNRFDEFSENFQTASEPPPSFWKIMLRFFLGGTKICNEIFRIGVTPPLFSKIHRYFP